jgi:hypothetical protein
MMSRPRRTAEGGADLLFGVRSDRQLVATGRMGRMTPVSLECLWC